MHLRFMELGNFFYYIEKKKKKIKVIKKFFSLRLTIYFKMYIL